MDVKYNYEGRVAIVTGAASGMGLATAKAFAEAGAAVMMADHNVELLKKEAEALQKQGFQISWLQCDVSEDHDIENLVSQTVQEFGKLDYAFNNAGVMAKVANTGETTRDDWERVIGINLRGVWSCMGAEIQQMEKQGYGIIVNTASTGAITGQPGVSPHIATKHGVLGLTRTAAIEYVTKNIRINAVNPGLIDTQIAHDVVDNVPEAYKQLQASVPMGRAGRPEEIASVVLWMCSEGASYLVGQGITVDGGFTV
nr:SDR family oxidoreductase [uncultured Desulfobulbus sp.]